MTTATDKAAEKAAHEKTPAEKAGADKATHDPRIPAMGVPNPFPSEVEKEGQEKAGAIAKADADFKEAVLKASEARDKALAKYPSDNLAEQAWNDVKDDADPCFKDCALAHRENLETIAADVRKTGIAQTPFAKRVAELLHEEKDRQPKPALGVDEAPDANWVDSPVREATKDYEGPENEKAVVAADKDAHPKGSKDSDSAKPKGK